ncbi:MAG: replication and repair protein RecF protein [Candidatus Collierbacteria bacterium GW2011_GWC1_45_47]|uniref:DNA replication and repair protein RecF n=2 Tax=Candidatus Collieribacteriota TaxID=1752725 RepID=A0A0G1GZF3_9BACT|nr:MAG: replication and repair protein RecF protein [Candidatus Collierbacteria bacterium GW2011_GWF1_44_12]KKT99117.1 MAG: replication and repair protein RecF protein [Candidatus Collierbacteria bacterium GW2011_GWC2_45_15]KKU09779.1 MAG: replication and repair protein RecF protein [Candidatus Collierbacteria bacterium GW2011_GWC1_45_47]
MLTKVTLTNFRSYEMKELEMSDGVNVVFGPNAYGKTNLLEAIFLMSVGDSFRAKRTEEMVRFGEELGRVGGQIIDEKGELMTIEVIVNGGVVMGKVVNKRKYIIDGVSKRRKDLVGLLPLVLFRPEDVELISGSPDVRRKFLDKVLLQTDKSYDHSLTTYEQALRRRNKLLDAIREGAVTRYSLTFWDGLMIKHGAIIQEKRREFVDYINSLFQRSELFNKLKLEYDASPISEARLEQYKDAETALGYTLVGPHKDDLMIKEEERNLSVYGSRGEQRMAVLACKMGEIYYLEEKTKRRAVLLLDDIFSELDEEHKQEVLRVMVGRQVIVTTADEGDVPMFKKVNLIRL